MVFKQEQVAENTRTIAISLLLLELLLVSEMLHVGSVEANRCDGNWLRVVDIYGIAFLAVLYESTWNTYRKDYSSPPTSIISRTPNVTPSMKADSPSSIRSEFTSS